MWPFTLVALFTDIYCNVTFVPAPFNVEKQTLWRYVEMGRSSRVAKGWKNFFSFFSPSFHPQKAPQGCPSGPSHAIGVAGGGQVGGLAGMVYPSVSLEMICTCCREVEWAWEIGAGAGKAKPQPDPPLLHCLGEGTEVLPEVGTCPGVFSISCLQAEVAQQWPEPCPPPENREQPLLPAAHLGGGCRGGFPSWAPTNPGHLCTHKNPHLHLAFPFLCSLLPSAPLWRGQMAAFLRLIQIYVFLNFGSWYWDVWFFLRWQYF